MKTLTRCLCFAFIASGAATLYVDECRFHEAHAAWQEAEKMRRAQWGISDPDHKNAAKYYQLRRVASFSSGLARILCPIGFSLLALGILPLFVPRFIGSMRDLDEEDIPATN